MVPVGSRFLPTARALRLPSADRNTRTLMTGSELFPVSEVVLQDRKVIFPSLRDSCSVRWRPDSVVAHGPSPWSSGIFRISEFSSDFDPIFLTVITIRRLPRLRGSRSKRAIGIAPVLMGGERRRPLPMMILPGSGDPFVRRSFSAVSSRIGTTVRSPSTRTSGACSTPGRAEPA